MFLLATAAVAGTVNLGWPCSRMNWAWRNVWSSCSINSFVPTDISTGDKPPAHYRALPLALSGAAGETYAPTNFLSTAGILVPQGNVGAGISLAVPQFFCDNMMKTSASPSMDITAFPLLRNRCRRAIDAYGGIVKACTAAPVLAGNRGPIQGNTLFPDYLPAAAHAPHVTNVDMLTMHANRCWDQDVKYTQPQSPSNTCPGLLGWFTVVWHACGFHKNIEQWTAAAGANAGQVPRSYQDLPNVAPLGTVLSPRIYFKETGVQIVANDPNDASAPNLFFCSPTTGASALLAAPGGGVPHSWNARGPNFRSSRCRKAMDQFGRTAARCGGTDRTAAAAPASGYNDRLRSLFLGHVGGSAEIPSSLYKLVPYCN